MAHQCVLQFGVCARINRNWRYSLHFSANISADFFISLFEFDFCCSSQMKWNKMKQQQQQEMFHFFTFVLLMSVALCVYNFFFCFFSSSTNHIHFSLQFNFYFLCVSDTPLFHILITNELHIHGYTAVAYWKRSQEINERNFSAKSSVLKRSFRNLNNTSRKKRYNMYIHNHFIMTMVGNNDVPSQQACKWRKNAQPVGYC